MEISSILLVLAVVLLVALYVYAPLSQNARQMRVGESQELSALKAERERVINSLQELDFDHALGKIPAEDYPDQRAFLLQKGADILRKLDVLVPAASSAKSAQARTEKGSADGSTAAGISDDEVESMIAARRKQHNGKSAGFCPKCGKPVLVSDKFCPSCGKSLQ